MTASSIKYWITMKNIAKYAISAVLASPAAVLIACFVWYAFTGVWVLPSGSDVIWAQCAVAWFSILSSALFLSYPA